jgi:hypothetical protein
VPTTLTRGATTLTLPDLLWPDEFAWQAVEQTTIYTITGALIVQASAKQAGRPVTLQSGAWFTRADLETLRTWAALPAESFTLVYRGTSLTVAFDHARGAITPEPLFEVCDPDGTDHIRATLRFIEV